MQFLRTGADRWQTAQREREAERTAYDTQLFGQQPEEEPIENLTGSLPEPPRPARHPAFDVAPYLEEEEKGRGASRVPAQQAPAQAAPAVPAAHRSDFDVDLGPDASTRALENAVHNDPLERIEIGPGGTFGLDPLAQLSRKKKAAAQPAPAPVPAENTGDFELRLEPEPETEPEVEDAADELDALIGRAMSNVPAQAPLTPAQEVSSEIRLDYPLPEEEPFTTTLEPVPQQEPPAPQPAPIPTLGGSFDEEDGFDEFDEDEEDAAAAAWKAGVPVSDLLTGRYQPQAAPAAPASPAAAPVAGRLRVSTSVGNSASAPVSSPPAAAKATPEAQALAAASREPAAPYCYPSLKPFQCQPPGGRGRGGARNETQRRCPCKHAGQLRRQTKILDICRGPSVTRYELQPQAGIKVSRITSLADDIALNLATAGVRIEAPIPGKPAVGIEVPNKIRATVNIRSVFEAQSYINMRSPLTMALARILPGRPQVADLCKMPHLLIAGSTGSGKSVCVNSIIISFLFRSGPEDVKLILIDPKVVELAEYNGIPHLLMPVVTEPRKAAGALGASVAEMERRYKLFAENNVRDIKSYNKLAKQNPVLEHLPYIAIVIDELADLMMVAGKEVEDYICRIAQKARAAGIHLIVATPAPERGRHHGPDQSQHPQPHRVCGFQPDRLAYHPGLRRRRKAAWQRRHAVFAGGCGQAGARARHLCHRRRDQRCAQLYQVDEQRAV